MAYNFVKSERTTLRALGLDERWLQERILEDPSLLGLGELSVVRREKRQVSGGRIDFLMADQEDDIRYAVEVMLGRLDESHIIRTIEYWDVERSRNPDFEHRAVLVAEEITSRFFNVIALLNRAVPLVAIQMTPVKLDDRFALTFTKVLDVVELNSPEDEAGVEQKDRAFWDAHSSKASMQAVDALLKLVPFESERRVAYNASHIAVGTSGVNFLWAHPRKKDPQCFFDLRLSGEERSKWIAQLLDSGVHAGDRGHFMKVRLTAHEIQAHADKLRSLLARVEELSR